MAGFLDGAFAPNRTPTPAAAAAADAAAAPPAATGGEATGDDVSARAEARWLTAGLIGLGILLAIVLEEKDTAFQPRDGFALFTGFYIAAQAIERLLELVPAGTGSKQAKANRAVVFPGFAFILGVLMAEKLGLYYVQAVGIAELSRDWDVVITALAIGGGTKPLHDAIKRIEKSKETPPTTT